MPSKAKYNTSVSFRTKLQRISECPPMFASRLRLLVAREEALWGPIGNVSFGPPKPCGPTDSLLVTRPFEEVPTFCLYPTTDGSSLISAALAWWSSEPYSFLFTLIDIEELISLFCINK
ncbi:hypothetical protein AVEN_48920-1 [Araneus ventricosus]|uniref:Uncharacterized protein n=1 Tax=Araneus ventricosus TaxID=182803 RepID=A0A4Y2AGJ9_ARAVE|nr:hypothetical protein AVEN_48920-1 [Araneus ventricosus]